MLHKSYGYHHVLSKYGFVIVYRKVFTLKKFDFSVVFSMRLTNKNVQKIIYKSFVFTWCSK